MSNEATTLLHKNLAALLRSMGSDEHAALLKHLEELNANTRATDVPADLTPGHPQYSAKAAAVWHARRAVRPDNLGRKTAKQALTKWFTEHAKEYGEDGLSKSAIKECAAVANWDTKGGAPKTPVTPPSHPRKPRR